TSADMLKLAAPARTVNELQRFLVVGGLAAFINWAARFPLDLVMPFQAAVVGAYVIGMVCGYLLYRRYVFPGSTTPVAVQVRNFIIVNLFGIVIVALLTPLLAHDLLPLLLGEERRELAEAIGHGLAIGTSAATSFVGHKWITFANRT